VDELAEHCSFLEVVYLLLYGELPAPDQTSEWVDLVMHHTMIHENIKKFMDGFHHDAHPMGMLISTVAALSTFYSDARKILDPEVRRLHIVRLIAKMPTLAAYAYRHSLGMPYVHPDNELSYTENFMNMLWKKTEPKYAANPTLARALDVLFILHADHEQNCSTNVMRAVGSAQADPYVTTAGAAAALSGPLHGGANEEVLRMLEEIGSKDRVPAYIQQIKQGHGRLMGFGHRVYKNYDPRAKIIKRIAEEVFEVTGRNRKLDVALEIERIALEDEYFIKHKLYPNVDFYSGIIYQAMGFTPDMFTVMFAIPRTVGWLAQWQEMLEDSEQKIARPRQVYTGHGRRAFVPMEERAPALAVSQNS
jgi:citrate synthase